MRKQLLLGGFAAAFALTAFTAFARPSSAG
jgi:hypothetical protein